MIKYKDAYIIIYDGQITVPNVFQLYRMFDHAGEVFIFEVGYFVVFHLSHIPDNYYYIF